MQIFAENAQFILALEDPDQPAIVSLLDEGESYAAALYPAESNHFLSLDELKAANVCFLVARNATGDPVATAALVLNGGWAELKRMWVVPEVRGAGLATMLLAGLESEAIRAGAITLRLETGIYNVEALRFYERSGFKRIDPFAPYMPDPLSVFMEKTLQLPPGSADKSN